MISKVSSKHGTLWSTASRAPSGQTSEGQADIGDTAVSSEREKVSSFEEGSVVSRLLSAHWRKVSDAALISLDATE